MSLDQVQVHSVGGSHDEMEVDGLLEGKIEEAIPKVETIPNKNPHWSIYVFPPALYICSYVALDIMIAHSARKGAYSYNPISLILVTESIKLTISSLLWLRRILRTPKHERRWELSPCWKHYALPSLMYTCWSILNFKCLLTVSLATFSVLYQSVVFFTAVAWIIAFNEYINWRQWIALAALCGGCMAAQITPDLRFEIGFSAIYVFIQAGLSAVASVLNEALLKQPVPINEQNTYLYTFSFLASLLWLGIEHPEMILDPTLIFNGWDFSVFCIALLAALIGMLVTLILKYSNVIVKVYAQAFHAPLEITIAHFTIHTPLGYMAIVSSAIIAASSIWYYAEREARRRADVGRAKKMVDENADCPSSEGADKNSTCKCTNCKMSMCKCTPNPCKVNGTTKNEP
mmetsp:Transcript_13296/g.19886  ORF Transcript_13296/g.19886 Transcript_13296/m.19886 type:complete len:402 (-) Transcript_13296:118-1323(-)|eukprot:CAMPEP_0167764050 /NCGR_PEP_ID=MMETSP0110_2-20121227/13779_1 /TAXON_ID=629695 /ORGANISM="Gymnochlora sp., Strain CCMP2014" /LENGTH=401 /DNA_ID=CAMNT_0007651335 /DNA_START=150 /DNA_END=1355 /DNA_ORIENTATION=-